MAIMLGASHFLGRIYTLVSYEEHNAGKARLYDSAVKKIGIPTTPKKTKTTSTSSTHGYDRAAIDTESLHISPGMKVETKEPKLYQIDPRPLSTSDTKLCPNLADLSMADSYLEDLVAKHKVFYYEGISESEQEREKRMIFYKIVYDSVMDYDYLVEDIITGDVREIWNRVHTLAQPNKLKQARTTFKLLHSMVKTKDISFFQWRTQFSRTLKNLKLMNLMPISEDYVKCIIIEAMSHDPRYSYTLRRIEEKSDYTVAQTYMLLTERAQAIQDVPRGANTTAKTNRQIYSLEETEYIPPDYKSDDDKIIASKIQLLENKRKANTVNEHKSKSNNVRTRYCFYYAKYGKCNKGKDCKFPHIKQPTHKYPVTNARKTRTDTVKPNRETLCFQWKRNGTCTRGDDCKFEHNKNSSSINMIETQHTYASL